MSMPAFPPGGGGIFTNMKPLWHPPVSMSLILAVVLIVVAANAEEIPKKFRNLLMHPIGFFILVLLCLGALDQGHPAFAFALLFFLLMVWSIHRRNQEGFSPSGALDWVTNEKLWFSEKIMKEKPIAIQEKDVATYPVQGT